MTPIEVTYYSDVLCIWAYVAQARVEEVKAKFGADVTIRYRFCSVFGDTRTKLETGWKDRGGIEAYGRHVLSVAARFPHVRVAPDVWLAARPASSASPHLFLAAMLDTGASPALLESVMWAFRRGFFAEGRDVAHWDIQCELAAPYGVDTAAIRASIDNGGAFARLSADYQDADKLRIEGSPTFVFNEARQKLYGNVGFRIIEANLRELLREPNPDEASWC